MLSVLLLILVGCGGGGGGGAPAPQPPINITSTAPTAATRSVLFNYQVTAIHNNATTGPFAYTLSNAPPGMTVSSSGAITWTPPVGMNRTAPVTVRVQDTAGAEATQTFTLTIAYHNPRLVVPNMDGFITTYALQGRSAILSFQLLDVRGPDTLTVRWSSNTTALDQTAATPVKDSSGIWRTSLPAPSDATQLAVRITASDIGFGLDSGDLMWRVASPPTPVAPGTPFPTGFWDTSNIPVATNVLTFKFLNRSNGRIPSTHMFWSFTPPGGTKITRSIQDAPTYDMPVSPAGRLNFYVVDPGDASAATLLADPTKSKYHDFIEHTIGTGVYRGNTTRVDAWVLPITMQLTTWSGNVTTVGDDYSLFQMGREAIFDAFIAGAPNADFAALAQYPFAPYKIANPGMGAFSGGRAAANYYNTFVDTMWANNNLSAIPKPGPNASGLDRHPVLSAAIYRHVGSGPGTFRYDAATRRVITLNSTLWTDPTTFYTAEPYNYYAKFTHIYGYNGYAYGFPYDDVGNWSTYISKDNPKHMLVSIGF